MVRTMSLMLNGLHARSPSPMPQMIAQRPGSQSARALRPVVQGGSLAVPPAPTLGGCRSAQTLPSNRAIPDPESIKTQKEQFALDLEEQLRQGVESLGQAHKQQTEALHTSANQEKHRYNLVLDQQVKQQELLLSQQYNEQLMRLQQAAQAQRAGLEKQACSLILEYQQQKVQEEFVAQQTGIQKQHQEAQLRLQDEMQKLSSKNGSAGSMSLPPGGSGMPSAMPSVALPVAVAQPACLMGAFAAPPMMGGVMQYVPPMAMATPTASRANSVMSRMATPGQVVVAPSYAYGQQGVMTRSASRDPGYGRTSLGSYTARPGYHQ